MNAVTCAQFTFQMLILRTKKIYITPEPVLQNMR